MMDLACPKCRSDNTQKLSLAVEGGTFSNKAATVGIGAGLGGAGIIAGSSSGSSTSNLAKKHAAPEKLPALSGSLAILFICWIVSLFAGQWALISGSILAVTGTLWGWKYNFADYPRELAEWNAKYLCLRCSDVFTPDANTSER